MSYAFTKKSKFILFNIVLVTHMLFYACSPSLAPNDGYYVNEDTLSVLDGILKKGVIRVGTTGDYLPFSYQSTLDTVEFKGLDIELARDLAQSLNVEVKFIKTSWSTLMADLYDNKYDIAMSGITINLARQKTSFFSIPLLANGKVAITRDENAKTYTTVAAINRPSVRVIVNPGGTNEEFARKHFPNAELILNDDNISVFQKIINEEADVMVTDAIEALLQEDIHPELEAVNTDNPFNFFEIGYLLPRDYVFKAYIDQWLNLRQKDGTYQRILDGELHKIKKD